jgi:hypothetical protein
VRAEMCRGGSGHYGVHGMRMGRDEQRKGNEASEGGEVTESDAIPLLGSVQ